ncbi:MAG: hypothetical protein RJB65_967, partial [Actinomycetota bacterium]
VRNPSYGTWNYGRCRTLNIGTVNSASSSARVCAQVSTSFERVTDMQTPWSVITLPKAGDKDGVLLNSSAVIPFAGSVYSSGRVNAGGAGTIAIDSGKVVSPEACNGTITVDGLPLDNAECVGTPSGDPGYAIADPLIPSAGTGSCNAVTDLATLAGGLWTSSAWTTAVGDCDYVHLQPGIYVMDAVALSITQKIIGGVPTTTPVTTALFTESALGCQLSEQGVQIVLSGNSTISLGVNGSLHLCGRAKDSDNDGVPDTGAPSISIYGPPTDQVGTIASLTPTSASGTVSSGSWSNTDKGRIIDATGYADTGNMATATLPARTTGPGGGPGTASLTLGGFGPSGTNYPTTGLSLTVKSAISDTLGTLAAVVSSASGGGTCNSASVKPSTTATLESVAVSLTCSGTLTAPLTVTISASNTASSTRSLRIDGATLSSTTPGIAKHTPPSAKDTLDQGGSGRHFWITDIIYIPEGKVNIQAPNTATFTTFDGMVARTLTINGTGGPNVKPIVGDFGFRRDGEVIITTTTGGREWLSSYVFFETNDSRTQPPAPNYRTWVLRT